PDRVALARGAEHLDALAHLDATLADRAAQHRVELASPDDPAAAGRRDLDALALDLDARVVDAHRRNVELEAELAQHVQRVRDQAAGAGLVTRELGAIEQQGARRETRIELRERE